MLQQNNRNYQEYIQEQEIKNLYDEDDAARNL